MSAKTKRFMMIFSSLFAPEDENHRKEYINHFENRQAIMSFARFAKSATRNLIQKGTTI